MNNNFFPLQSVKKFYFLEYFYVLLKSIEKHTNKKDAFESFKKLKHEYKLGESKYKKLSVEPNNLTRVQLNRYKYTFNQVIEESKEYGLLSVHEETLKINDEGKNLIFQFENKMQDFYETLFTLMENKYNAFYKILNFLYNANIFRRGLIVLPSYSPRQLQFEKNDICFIGDYLQYLKKLQKQLENDILKYIGKNIDLTDAQNILLNRLSDNKLIKINPKDSFPHKSYNVITKRVRDYWISFFLKDIYGFDSSFSAFEIWTYRAKQIGIVNATDFYPNFNGRIVYPTAIINKTNNLNDFKSIYDYSNNEKMLIHIPSGDDVENKFVDHLVKNYFHLRNQSNNYFVRLTSLKELACYNMKISETTFENLLNSIYLKNLSGDLKIKISLEVDKLPEDTKSMYIKRAPVMVDGKYRNIIAIDIGKKEKKS